MQKLLLTILWMIVIFSCKEKSDDNNIKSIQSITSLANSDSAMIFEPKTVSLKGTEEFGITFTKDMKALFFTSKRNNAKHYSIYTSKFKDGSWQKPKIASFSGQYFDADAFVNLDGNKVFFFSMRPMSQDTIPLKTPNIWYVEKEHDSWGIPRPVAGQLNSSASGEGYLSLTKNGTIYLSSVGRLKGTKHDIFKSNHINNLYEEPSYVNIDIKTNFSNPYISPNEDFLIIDSRKPNGEGGNDLYLVKRIGDNTWQEPVNMGKLINTGGDEGTPSLSPDGRWFFFSRDGDIYYIEAKKVIDGLL